MPLFSLAILLLAIEAQRPPDAGRESIIPIARFAGSGE